MVNAQKWKKWTIGEMISRTKTTIQTGPFGTVLSASEFVDYGIPIISVREIREGFIRITAETPCITDDTYSRLRKYALSEKDIVFARKGSVERSALIPIGLERYFLGSDGIRIRFDQNIVSPDLMLYLFQSPSTKQFLIQSSYGTTMAGLNEKILSALEFYLPETIDEQERIAKVLADIDHLLALTEKLITKKKAIKQGAMQELLTGKRRLPGFSEKWEQRTFYDVCEIRARMVDPTQKEYADLPHIGNESIEKFSGRITHYSKAKDDQLRSGKYLFGINDVLYGKINPHFAKAAFPKFEGLCSADMYPISCKDTILPEYLLYVLLSSDFTNYTISLSKRSGIPKVNRDELADYLITLPSLDEQKEISNALHVMDVEIESLMQKLEKYRRVKQGMMQQLLTGKIRLV